MTRARLADGGERLLPADIRTGFLRTDLTTCAIMVCNASRNAEIDNSESVPCGSDRGPNRVGIANSIRYTGDRLIWTDDARVGRTNAALTIDWRCNRMATSSVSTSPIGSDLLSTLIYSPTIRRLYLPPHYFLSCVDLMAIFGEDNRKAKSRELPFNPTRYWSDHKKALLGKDSELYDSIVQLKLPTPDGKKRLMDLVPDWGAIFLILLMDTPKATEFKKAFAKGAANVMTPAMLKQRAVNIASGLEWSADSINLRMPAIEPDEKEDKWWQR